VSKPYEFLDVITITACLILVGFIIWVLAFVHDIPQSNLPILAGLAGTILGIVLTYAAFRFQIPNKRVPDTPAGAGTVSLDATITTPPATPALDPAPNSEA